MIAYLDSSIALRIVLGEPDPLRGWREVERSISSAILRVECFRALDRLRLARRHTDQEISARYESLSLFLTLVDFLAITDNVLQRAAQPFGVPLRTLDAIHLATAILWRESQSGEFLFATHDRSLGLAALAYDFRVVGI